jgi:uncharacterized protein (TIGR02452 family)
MIPSVNFTPSRHFCFAALVTGFAATIIMLVYRQKVRSLSSEELRSDTQREIVDLYFSTTGNPAHLGHMHAVALAAQKVVQEGYQIGKVKIVLSDEAYAKTKVEMVNLSIARHNQNQSPGEQQELPRILIPRETRIKFLKAAIQQAKDESVFDKDLLIDDDPSPFERNRKVFHVRGGDYIEERGESEYVVIVIRDEELPDWVAESIKNRPNIFVVKNSNPSATYSSSKIQNGAYNQLPESVREEFRKLRKDPLKVQEIQTSRNSPMVAPEQLKKLTVENLDLVDQGFYLNSQDVQINLKPAEELAVTTKSYLISSLLPSNLSSDKKTVIEVINTDSLHAAKIRIDEGEKVAVLNFASPIEPGGGFSEGTMAQEESLCYASPELSAFFTRENYQGGEGFYLLKAKEGYAPTDHLIHTPNVAISRGTQESGYPLLDIPFHVGIISAAAPCRPRLTHDGKYANPADEDYLQKCIITQLTVACEEGYDSIILGAFGCGAFKNPPKEVAKIYHDVITSHFPKAFKAIVFAVIDDTQGRGAHNPQGNYQPFKDIFLTTDV